jgi:hypothetical protein
MRLVVLGVVLVLVSSAAAHACPPLLGLRVARDDAPPRSTWWVEGTWSEPGVVRLQRLDAPGDVEVPVLPAVADGGPLGIPVPADAEAGALYALPAGALGVHGARRLVVVEPWESQPAETQTLPPGSVAGCACAGLLAALLRRRRIGALVAEALAL